MWWSHFYEDLHNKKQTNIGIIPWQQKYNWGSFPITAICSIYTQKAWNFHKWQFNDDIYIVKIIIKLLWRISVSMSRMPNQCLFISTNNSRHVQNRLLNMSLLCFYWLPQKNGQKIACANILFTATEKVRKKNMWPSITHCRFRLNRRRWAAAALHSRLRHRGEWRRWGAAPRSAWRSVLCKSWSKPLLWEGAGRSAGRCRSARCSAAVWGWGLRL